MNTVKINNSLAGSPRRYIIGQARVKNGGLHLQFRGPSGNRHYGYSTDVKAQFSSGFIAANTEPSLAETPALYFPLQATPYDGDTIHIQVPAPAGNRSYGEALNVKDAGLLDWLKTNLKAAPQPTPAPMDVEDEGDDWDEDEDSDDDEDETEEKSAQELINEIRSLQLQITGLLGQLEESVQ